MSSTGSETSRGRVLPGNPLGMIATFVFLIETVATVSLHAVADKAYAVALVWFIIAYPSVIALLFFVLLWFKREALYAPMDFGDAETFRDLILKKVERIEAKQDVAGLERDTSIDEIMRTAERLLTLEDPWTAIGVGQSFLRKKDYVKAAKILEMIASRSRKTDEHYYKVIANWAYAKIGLSDFEGAISLLLEVKRLNRGKNFGAWHALALAYAYTRSNNPQEARRWVSVTQERGGHELDKEFFTQLYPELSDEIARF